MLLIIIIAGCANINSNMHYGNDIDITSQGTNIYHHGGGNAVNVHIMLFNAPKPIRIFGLCASACTYALRFKSTCVFPQSQIMFHAHANHRDGTINVAATKSYLNVMPNKIKEFLYKKLLPNAEFTKTMKRRDFYFSGESMHNLLGVPYCE